MEEYKTVYATEYYVWSAQYILNRCRSCSGACFARVRPGIPVFELPQLLDMLGPQDMHHVEKPFLFALHTLAVQSQAQTVAPREVGEQNLDVSRHRLNYHVVARLQAHRCRQSRKQRCARTLDGPDRWTTARPNFKGH